MLNFWLLHYLLNSLCWSHLARVNCPVNASLLGLTEGVDLPWVQIQGWNSCDVIEVSQQIFMSSLLSSLTKAASLPARSIPTTPSFLNWWHSSMVLAARSLRPRIQPRIIRPCYGNRILINFFVHMLNCDLTLTPNFSSPCLNPSSTARMMCSAVTAGTFSGSRWDWGVKRVSKYATPFRADSSQYSKAILV